MWLAAVCSLMNSAAPISRLLIPRATRLRISTSRAESSSGWRLTGAEEPSARTRGLGVEGPRGGLPDGLSFREVQILGLVAKGMSNREIGSALFISEHTAANHIRSILRKTRCANRTEAASYAHRHGVVGA